MSLITALREDYLRHKPSSDLCFAKATFSRKRVSSARLLPPMQAQVVLRSLRRPKRKAYRAEGSDQMRYVLAAILICTAGIPAASALPTVSPNALALSKARPFVQVAKRNRPRAHRHSSGGAGGIHPLVGSGDY
jgi:hypothetical protein